MPAKSSIEFPITSCNDLFNLNFLEKVKVFFNSFRKENVDLSFS